MTLYIIIRYLHFLGIFVWVGALTAEWVLLQPELPRKTVKRLMMIDRLYGLAAIVVVGMGLLMWFKVGKPAEFYNTNGLFHLKVGLAGAVGLLSLYPTRFFARQAKGEDQEAIVNIPPSVRQFILAELLIMIIIPLLAVLMATGLGS
ncbi:MAG: DUF2214 family protein [Bacteroidota bacterium]